jgi:hypothetical protein
LDALEFFCAAHLLILCKLIHAHGEVASAFSASAAASLHRNTLSLDNSHFSNIGAFTVSMINTSVQAPCVFVAAINY